MRTLVFDLMRSPQLVMPRSFALPLVSNGLSCHLSATVRDREFWLCFGTPSGYGRYVKPLRGALGGLVAPRTRLVDRR